MSKAQEIFVLNKAVRLKQPVDGFRTSIDAVLLAAACPAKAGETVLDMGCGVGTAGLCVLHRVPDAKLSGIDIQDDHIALAKENARLNGQQARFECGDIRDFKNGSFDHVICNPPFLESGSYLASPSEKKARALGHLDETSLKDWMEAAFRNLKNGGSFTLIHRADHTDKIIQNFGKHYGAVEIIPLWPKHGRPAKRVIIRAIKNRKSPAALHPGLVLHDEDGAYTQQAEKILRQGAAIL